MSEQNPPERGKLWDWFAMRAKGPHGIFWLIAVSFLEPIFLPLIPESVMGALILANPQHWKRYVGITSVMTALGGITGYYIGAFLFKGVGVFLLSDAPLHRLFSTVEALLHGNVFLVMLFVIVSPIPDKVFVIMAGFFHAPIIPFALGFFLGRILRFGIIGWLIHHFGPQLVGTVRRYFEWFALVVLIICTYVLLHFLHIVPSVFSLLRTFTSLPPGI